MSDVSPKMDRSGSNMEGRTFGYFTVLQEVKRTGTSRRYWLCKCKCGNERIVAGKGLRNGQSSSCGCKRYERKHISDPAYPCWYSMKSRCQNPNNDSYHRYGGRGIFVCEAWQDFAKFRDDMGPRPSRKYSIERVNNNDGYHPGNCCWATRKQQSANTRKRARRTHCKRGHELSGDNLKIKGERHQCRKCIAIRYEAEKYRRICRHTRSNQGATLANDSSAEVVTP